jgi:hypothetical protein
VSFWGVVAVAGLITWGLAESPGLEINTAPDEAPMNVAPVPDAPAAERLITYTVTGTKAPGDRINVTYTDASGRSRTQQNVYIPWSLTVTPISTSSGLGSIQASSSLGTSKLNCSIAVIDGTVLASNNANSSSTIC